MNSKMHSIIPEEEAHCVWMDAGLVNYKLCDRRYECDSCPFDGVMKEQHHTFAVRAAMHSEHLFSDHQETEIPDDADQDPLERIMAPFRSVVFPEERIYFSDHTWMKSMKGGMILIGIDQFLAMMIRPISSVASVHTPSHIGRNEPFAWLMRDSGTFAVRTNERGTATVFNTRLTEQPSLVTRDPYGEGWLMQINCAEVKDDNLNFFTARDSYKLLCEEVGMLARTVKNKMHTSGKTMYDGGTRIETIEKIIGEKEYNKMLSRLMSPH